MGNCNPKTWEILYHLSVPEALDIPKLVENVEAVIEAPQQFCSACTQSLSPSADTCHVVLVEGTMILSIRYVRRYMHVPDSQTCKRVIT